MSQLAEKRYFYITPDDYERAEANGIRRKALSDRVRSYGWDVDKAVNDKIRVSQPFEPTWQKWREVCEQHGISRRLFYHRIKTGKMSEELAATKPLHKYREPRKVKQ